MSRYRGSRSKAERFFFTPALADSAVTYWSVTSNACGTLFLQAITR